MSVPEERRAKVRFVKTLFSRVGMLIVIYILLGIFLNTAPPHVPTIAATPGALHSWVQYFVSIFFWPLSFWTPTFNVGEWQP
jgi:hypothetical protein